MILKLLALPVVGPALLVQWAATTLVEEATLRALDESRIRSDLAALIESYDAGQLSDAEYQRQEEFLLQRLDAAREQAARRPQPAQVQASERG